MEQIIIKKIKEKYSQEYLQNHFEKKCSTKIMDNYFEYVKTDEVFVFSDEDLKELKYITKYVDKIFLKWYDYYIKDIEKNLNPEKYFFIDYLKNTFVKEEYLISRYDVAIEKNTKKLKFLEINANTPWMITDINDVACFLKPKWYKNISSIFPTYIKNKFKKYAWKKLAILLPYSYADEDFMVCHDYRVILEEVFWAENIIIWDIFESNIVWNNFLLKWEKIDVILNFFPLEFFLTDLSFAKDFFDIVKNWFVDLYNNIESIIMQDKLMFAIIWENINKYSKLEQKIIKDNIPYTTRVFQEDENKFMAKFRWWRLSRWVFDKDFYSNIDDKNYFVFQEKIFSQIIDDENNFIILWIYSNFVNTKAIIARKQNVLITDDDKVKVLACYKENSPKISIKK